MTAVRKIITEFNGLLFVSRLQGDDDEHAPYGTGFTAAEAEMELGAALDDLDDPGPLLTAEELAEYNRREARQAEVEAHPPGGTDDTDEFENDPEDHE